MATKRRKVWVNLYGGEYGKSDTFRAVVYMQRSRAIAYGNGAETAPFIEHLPGDVVLSREEVDAIAGKMMDAKAVEYDAPSVAMYLNEALALLRGRR